MAIKVEDYIDVRSQAASLGLPEPSGLKFLPRNFAKAESIEDFVYPDSVIDVQRLLVADGVDVTRIDADRTAVRAIEHSNEWTVPALFATALAFQHAHPDLVKTIISTIQAQAKRIFRGVIGATKVKWEIVLDQPGRGTKKVSFEGPTEELPKLEEFLNKMLQEGAKDDGRRLPKEVNEELDSYQSFIFMARGIEFQKEACESLSKLSERILDVKQFAKEKNDEPLANHMFFLNCVVRSFYKFCEMWVRLKSDQMDEAWDSLISAQQALKAALAANDDPTLEPFNQRLHQAEDLLFPPQIFNSIGLKVKSTKCSLCHCEYGACEHFKGRVYMGEMCSMVVSESELDHVSVVETPEDKHCRMTTFDFDGVSRDVMTWRPAPKAPDRKGNFTGIFAKAR